MEEVVAGEEVRSMEEVVDGEEVRSMEEVVAGEEVRSMEEVVRQLLPHSALLHNCLMLSLNQVTITLTMILRSKHR